MRDEGLQLFRILETGVLPQHSSHHMVRESRPDRPSAALLMRRVHIRASPYQSLRGSRPLKSSRPGAHHGEVAVWES